MLPDGDWIEIYEMAIAASISKEEKAKSCAIQDRLFLHVVGDKVGNLHLNCRKYNAVTETNELFR